MSGAQTTEMYERRLTPPERFFARSPFSIVTMIARIRGRVSEEMLRDALAKVQRRHVPLRVRIKEDGQHGLWFTSEGVHAIPVETRPRSSEDDWIRIHAEACRVPFDFPIRPPIRFLLLQGSDMSELIIVCHHTICDGMSLAYLARDVMVHLGDPDQEADMLPAPSPINSKNLPHDISQSGLARFVINRMNRKWAGQKVTFDHEDYEALTNAYWERYNHGLFSIELSDAQTSALVARCREKRVTVTSALAIAFARAQSLVEGERDYHRDLVIAASVRDRLPISPGEGMGFYAGSLEPRFRYNQKRSFWENVLAFHTRARSKFTNKHLFRDINNWLYLEPTIFDALHFKKLGGLVPPGAPRHEKLSAFSQREDIILRIMRRDHIESLETKRWGTAVTNLGRLSFPLRYGALELDRLIMQPGSAIPLANVNLVLGAVTCSGRLSLVIEYAQEAIDSAAVTKIKDQALGLLTQA